MSNLPELDYTARDYTTMRDALLARIVDRFPDFDTSPGSPDVVLLEAVAGIAGWLSYFENRSINEAFLPRARLRKSVIDHCARIDYQLASAQPAKVPVRFRLARTYPDAAPFPQGTRIETDDSGVSYETDDDLTISPGLLEGTVGATEGRTVEDATAGIAALDAPSGQRFVLSSPSFIGSSERVTVGANVWTRVDTFLLSDSFSRHYVVERDTSDVATIVFGDGTNGLRPTVGTTIRVRYRVGGGTRGAVRPGRLNRASGSFYSLGGTALEFTVTNPSASTPGADRETIEHARVAAPLALRATTRTIAREDYELHALEVDGVGRALCHTHNEDATIPYLMHRLYVIPIGGGIASPSLRQAVYDYLTVTKPRDANAALIVVPAIFLAYVPTLTLIVRRGTDTNAVANAAESAMRNFFYPETRAVDSTLYTVNFGRPVFRSELEAILQVIPGVEHVRITLPVDDASTVPPYATIEKWEFPIMDGAPSITVVEKVS